MLRIEYWSSNKKSRMCYLKNSHDEILEIGYGSTDKAALLNMETKLLKEKEEVLKEYAGIFATIYNESIKKKW